MTTLDSDRHFLIEATLFRDGHMWRVVMSMVVTEPCFGCKYTDCVVVCPAECFYEGESMLFIHPDECIDCGACVPECPVQAIYYEDDVPEPWWEYIELNRGMSLQYPQIREKKEPLLGGQ